MKEALLIYAASDQDANLFYATGFWAPDPFIFVGIQGKKILVMSDLEIDRARSESRADEILSLSRLSAEAKGRSPDRSGVSAVLDLLFQKRGVKQLRVPPSFPVALADSLRGMEYALQIGQEPFFPERMIKRAEEVQAIRETIRCTEEALKSALDVIAQAEIRGEELWLRGRPLTSELIRKTLHLVLMGSDCLGHETIVAGGTQACNPHGIGSGVLRAHWPIVLDVFPVSLKSRYYADITRTVVKGKPSEKVRRMHTAVRQGQEIAFGMLKPGADGRKIHQAILDHFSKEGFPTGEAGAGGGAATRLGAEAGAGGGAATRLGAEAGGRMIGFFHGTGHGIGLEIHEPPRIGPVSEVLKAGQVVTVEPGLYYPDAGGIRIEDDVLITAAGCEVLTAFPKALELD